MTKPPPKPPPKSSSKPTSWSPGIPLGTYRIRSLIYGSKDKMDAFLTAQQLVLQSPIFNMFRGFLTRYTMVLNLAGVTSSIIPAEIHILDLDSRKASWRWSTNEERAFEWHEFLHHAQQMGLAWEFAKVGQTHDDSDYLHSPKHRRMMWLGAPSLNTNFEKEREIPLNLF
jgi:hypothetical protein